MGLHKIQTHKQPACRSHEKSENVMMSGISMQQQQHNMF